MGGSSLLLGVPRLVISYFPQCAVYANQAVRGHRAGACRYMGQDFNPTLVHDYCLRSWDATAR